MVATDGHRLAVDVAAVSEMTAFDTRELDRLLGQSKGQTDPDEVLDPPADPVTTLGDLWVLGQHPAPLRKRHERRRCGAAARWRIADPHGDGPTVWGPL